MQRWLSPKEVCEMIPGMSEALLAQMRYRGDGPKFIAVSPRKRVYALEDIEEYMAGKVRTSTAVA